MAKLLLVHAFVVAFVVGFHIRESAAQSKSRVCFAQSGDYSTNTALGFCSHAIYLALTATSNAGVVPINPTVDANPTTGGVAKFASRKTVYPYVEMYLGVVVDRANLGWLSSGRRRTTFISNLLTEVRMHPQFSGVYVDFVGLTSGAADYAAFIFSLNNALANQMLKLTTALPHDAVTYAGIYYNPTLRTLPFNVLKTYEDMYETSSRTHPLSPLNALAAPFDTRTISDSVFRWIIRGLPESNIVLGLPMYSVRFTVSGATAFGRTAASSVTDTYCNALIFGSTNTAGPVQYGESFSYSASTFYTYNTFAALDMKLQFITVSGSSLGGVGIFSLDQAGSTNAEMLRYVTSVLAPSPPTGFTYPAAGPATCGVMVPVPVATTTTTTPTTTTTTTPTTTTTTTTPTTTTTTTTPTTTTTTPTTTTTTTTTTTPTTTTTTTPSTTTTTTTPTTTTTTTTPTTTTTTPTTTTTTTPTTTTTTGPTTTTAAPPVSTVTCGVAVVVEFGTLVSEYCSALAAITLYLSTASVVTGAVP